MPITGLVPGMAIHFAGCCHPVPGDDIVGIVTTGKGVTIHSRDCQTLRASPRRPSGSSTSTGTMRRVGKGAPDGKGAGHTARISVIAANEPARWPT